MHSERSYSIDETAAVRALREIGIDSGAVLYVAASLGGLAMLPDPVGLVLAALDATVGPTGTLVMPTFHSGFRFEAIFDRERSPSRSGMLSETFRTRPGTLRTWSPPYNPVAVSGHHARAFAALRSATAFGVGSVFDHLVTIDATVLLAGCNFHDGVAHVHWLEERHQVPYRTWHDFSGRVVLDGVESWHTWPCHIRNAGIDLNASPLGDLLANSGAMRETDLGLTRLAAFSLHDFVKVVDTWFAKNTMAMVVN